VRAHCLRTCAQASTYLRTLPWYVQYRRHGRSPTSVTQAERAIFTCFLCGGDWVPTVGCPTGCSASLFVCSGHYYASPCAHMARGNEAEAFSSDRTSVKHARCWCFACAVRPWKRILIQGLRTARANMNHARQIETFLCFVRKAVPFWCCLQPTAESSTTQLSWAAVCNASCAEPCPLEAVEARAR